MVCMPKAKKDGRHVNIYMAKELSDRLNRFCEYNNIPKTAVIEKSLFEFLNSQPDAYNMNIQPEDSDK